jgi:hypothetical protein
MAGRFWMLHWKNRLWRPDINQDDWIINHSAGNRFTSRGVSRGDAVYIVTLIEGQLFLGGKMTVDRVVDNQEAIRLFGDWIYEAGEHLVGAEGSGTPLKLRRRLSSALTKRLRYQSRSGPKPLFFKSDESLDNQATRGTLELTVDSAAIFDDIIELTDPLPLTNEILTVADKMLSVRSISQGLQAFRLPDEVPVGTVFSEGRIDRIDVNRYERDRDARTACIAAHGAKCCVCGMSFAEVYGPETDGYIHVHHLRSLAELGGEYRINAVDDLRPVCPNCHAVIHHSPGFSIDEVRAMLARQLNA